MTKGTTFYWQVYQMHCICLDEWDELKINYLTVGNAQLNLWPTKDAP